MIKKIIIGFFITVLIIIFLFAFLIFLLVKDNPDFAPYA